VCSSYFLFTCISWNSLLAYSIRRFLGLFKACVLSSGYLTLVSKLTQKNIIFHDYIASKEISLQFWNPKVECTLTCSQSLAIEPCSDQGKTYWQSLKSCFFKINFNIVLQSGFPLEVCQPKCYMRFLFAPMRAAPICRNCLSIMKDVIVCCIHHSFHILFTGRAITIILQRIVRLGSPRNW